MTELDFGKSEEKTKIMQPQELRFHDEKYFVMATCPYCKLMHTRYITISEELKKKIYDDYRFEKDFG